MQNALFERNNLNVDASILLKRGDGEASPAAVIDRELADPLALRLASGSWRGRLRVAAGPDCLVFLP